MPAIRAPEKLNLKLLRLASVNKPYGIDAEMSNIFKVSLVLLIGFRILQENYPRMDICAHRAATRVSGRFGVASLEKYPHGLYIASLPLEIKIPVMNKRRRPRVRQGPAGSTNAHA